MKVFYGAAIQGDRNRGTRRLLHKAIIDAIRDTGNRLASEHVTGSNLAETAWLLTESLGPLPPGNSERTVYIRNKMIELIEGDIDAAIFEVSVPSLGTGIEIAHAYLRPRMGLPEIPILALYEKEFWPNKLSSMVRGLLQNSNPNFYLKEFTQPKEASHIAKGFLQGLTPD